MRVTVALIFKELGTEAMARIQCFVDDPLIALGGPKAHRDHCLLRVVLLWLVLGFKLSWGKGARGRRVEWIGACFGAWKSPSGEAGVTVSITEDRIRKLSELCRELLNEAERVPKGKLRQLAGLATWMVGVM